jgi:DNA helicase-2/ATP-dependent DNA helicase PcrA
MQHQNPRARYQFSEATAKAPLFTPSSNFKIGQMLQHPKFGEGIVLNQEGSGEQARLQIKFREVGVKWIMASFFAQ